MKHRMEMIVFSALNSMREHKTFEESYSTIKNVLRSIYLTADNDGEFSLAASMFLSQAAFGRGVANGVLSNIIEFYSVEVGERSDYILVRNDTDPDCHQAKFEYPELLMREREDWDTYFMNMARNASERTTCKSGRKVGAVFVHDKVPLMSGFNGVPPGYPHPKTCPRIEAGCKSGEGLDKCPCNHAERNAVNLAAKHGIVLRGSTLYCTARPCSGCIGDMAVVGIKRVIYDRHYPHDVTDEVVKHANIELIKFGDM